MLPAGGIGPLAVYVSHLFSTTWFFFSFFLCPLRIFPLFSFRSSPFCFFFLFVLFAFSCAAIHKSPPPAPSSKPPPPPAKVVEPKELRVSSSVNVLLTRHRRRNNKKNKKNCSNFLVCALEWKWQLDLSDGHFLDRRHFFRFYPLQN